MAKTKADYPFGRFLKSLREKKGVSLIEVEKATGMSNAYLSQLETGARRRLPTADRLHLLADYYDVSIKELMEKAGYYETKDTTESYEQKIDKAFMHVVHDPQFSAGFRIKPEDVSTDVKRYVLEMYSRNVRKSLLFMSPQAAGRVMNKNMVKLLKWKTEEVIRDIHKVGGKTLIRYRVRVTCTETEGEVDQEKIYFEGPIPGTEKITHTAIGEGTHEENTADIYGHEAYLLLKATDNAVRDALTKIKGINWESIIRPGWET